MKKDKKWFIDKWTKERNKTDVHDPMYHFISEFIADVKELDEPEVLSQKWIDEHATAVTYDEILDRTETTYVVDLENLIIPKEESEVTLNRAFEKIAEAYPMTKEEVCRHLEKFVAHGGRVTYGEPEVLSQELPVIPKYVADWITKHREKFDLYPALKKLEGNPFGWERTYEWYRVNTHEFVNVYLTGEYEVEEEQKYYVNLDTAAYVAKWKGDDRVDIYTESISGNDEFEFHLTEEEIKNYDERFWSFAEPVEEGE